MTELLFYRTCLFLLIFIAAMEIGISQPQDREYFLKHKVKEMKECIGRGSNYQPLTRQYFISEDGLISRMIDYSNENDSTCYITSHFYAYDSLGRIAKEIDSAGYLSEAPSKISREYIYPDKFTTIEIRITSSMSDTTVYKVVENRMGATIKRKHYKNDELRFKSKVRDGNYKRTTVTHSKSREVVFFKGHWKTEEFKDEKGNIIYWRGRPFFWMFKPSTHWSMGERIYTESGELLEEHNNGSRRFSIYEYVKYE